MSKKRWDMTCPVVFSFIGAAGDDPFPKKKGVFLFQPPA
jgi:hypothetical protein